MEEKIYKTRDEFLYDDGFTDEEKIDIARIVFETEEILEME